MLMTHQASSQSLSVMKSLFAPHMKLKCLKKPKAMVLIHLRKSKKSFASSVRNRRKRNQRNAIATSLMKTNPKKMKRVTAMMTVKAKAVRNAAAAEAAVAVGVSAGMRMHLKSQMKTHLLMKLTHPLQKTVTRNQNLAVVAVRPLVRSRMTRL